MLRVWAFVVCSSVVFFLSLSRGSTFSPLSTCSLSCTSTSTVSNPPRIRPSAHPHNEEYCSTAMHNPPTGYEPKLFDKFDYSEKRLLQRSSRVQFWCSLESNLSGKLNFHLVAKCAHDMSLALQIVRTRQCALSWSIVRFQLFSRILHQYKSWSIHLVVEAFPLVLCASATDFLVQESQSKVQVSLSRSLLARTMGQIALPKQVSLFLFDSYCILHINLRLLPRYWADLKKWLCDKQFQSFPHRHRSVERYTSHVNFLM